MLAQIFDAITNLAGAEDIISQRYPNGQWIADFGLRIFRSAEPFLWIMGLGLPAEFAKDPQSQSAIANPQSAIGNRQSQSAIGNPHSIGVLCQIGSQKPSRIGVAALHEFFWGALEEDLPACISALWSEVDDPVRGLQHVQIVLYHNQGIP